MRRHLSVLAALAIGGSAAVLATPGTAAAAPAHVPAVTPALAPVKAGPPLSPLKLTVYYPKAVYQGGAITYTLKTKNVGEYATDIAYVGGLVPKGVSKVRIISKPSGAYCERSGREVGCLLDTLKPGRTATIKVKAWLSRRTTGNAYAEFASASIDVPAGQPEVLDIYGLELGTDLRYVKVKTRIVRW
ncbi:hypothetical protein GCM10023259_076480 [Thermocatellispora tengchongensis]